MTNAEKPALRWVKIGEITLDAGFFTSGLYCRYAIFELVQPNGLRKYKRVFMTNSMHEHEILSLKSAPEIFTPT